MADTPKLCPTCHSVISSTGSRVKDKDSTGVPVWSGDPILTSTGLNGPSYTGQQFTEENDFIEIQSARIQQEKDAGISPLTEFSSIVPNKILCQACHIIELRISTERILGVQGTSLQDYFRTDIDGNAQPAGPQDIQDKTDWTDVKRGSSFKSNGKNKQILINNNQGFKINGSDTEDKALQTPTIPTDIILKKGIHIEDLRHPILSNVLIEVFAPALPVSITPDQAVISDPPSRLAAIIDFVHYLPCWLWYTLTPSRTATTNKIVSINGSLSPHYDMAVENALIVQYAGDNFSSCPPDYPFPPDLEDFIDVFHPGTLPVKHVTVLESASSSAIVQQNSLYGGRSNKITFSVVVSSQHPPSNIGMNMVGSSVSRGIKIYNNSSFELFIDDVIGNGSILITFEATNELGNTVTIRFIKDVGDTTWRILISSSFGGMELDIVPTLVSNPADAFFNFKRLLIPLGDSSIASLFKVLGFNATKQTSGLIVNIDAGKMRISNILTDITAQTIAVADNTTNYVELSTAGIVLTNTSGFTLGVNIPLAEVTALGGNVTAIIDKINQKYSYQLITAGITITEAVVGSTGGSFTLSGFRIK